MQKLFVKYLLIVIFGSVVLSLKINWQNVPSGQIFQKSDETKHTNINGRIFNGSLVTTIEDFSYQIGILTTNSYNQEVWCGGSIISETFLLTAAHCLFELQKAVIYIGVVNRRNPEINSVLINITNDNVVLHENYDPEDFFYNDIGLIRLPIPLNFTDHIRPVELINLKDANSIDNKIAVISGWGDTTDFGDASDYLQYAKFKILSKEICQKYINSLPLNFDTPVNTSSLICADPEEKSGICGGDSGGAAVINVNNKQIQVAINSFGIHLEDKPCESVLANVFLRISDYIQWICSHSDVCPL